MGKILLTTDTHFGHKKIIEYCGRPKNFESLILRNILDLVRYDDILIHLGDICIGDDEKWNKKLSCRMEPAKMWLLKGNHDHKSDNWYLDHGWDFVGDQILIEKFGKRILFSHVPKKDLGYFDINIHGHFHNSLHRLRDGKYIDDGEKVRNEKDLAILTEKHKLLSIENTNYKPVLLDDFLKGI